MTRISLFFVSTVVACVIGLAPQKETGASFQPAPVKTRSLSATGMKPVEAPPLRIDACASSAQQACRVLLPGSAGPRG